jgi:hypothetical protein
MKNIVLFLVGSIGFLSSSNSWGAIIAYDNTVQTGNQAFTGPLGMDFNVNSPIVVTALGVFDSGGGLLRNTLTATLYNRATQTAVAQLMFPDGTAATLVNGDLFKDLPNPVLLPAGFQGSIVAQGFGANQPNGNATLLPPFSAPVTNSGGGLISFVGTSRYGTAGTFPATPDALPNQYGAGTFTYSAAPMAGAVPEPATFALLGAGFSLLAGSSWVRRRRTAA